MKIFYRITVIFCCMVVFLACDTKNTQNITDLNSKPAHDFNLKVLGKEGKIKLSDYKGQPVILNFWASWCAPCREEMPFLQKTWDQYKDQGLNLIGINVIDDTESAIEFLNSFNINYINVEDKSGRTSNKYGVIALPATFFIDKHGNISKQNYGPFLGESGEKMFITYTKDIL